MSVPRPLLLTLALAGCGAVDPKDGDDAHTDGGVDTDHGDPLVPQAQVLPLRRLTARELDRTVRTTLGDLGVSARSYLPEDLRTPFDDEAASQTPSRVLVEGLDAFARAVAARLRADPERLAAAVGCELTSTACLPAFVDRVGGTLLRRPLDAGEQEALVAVAQAASTAERAPEAGVEAVISVLLQDAELLYVLDRGTPVPGAPQVIALDDPSIVTRMALLLWGAAPDAAVLAEVGDGRLQDPSVRGDLARRMLADPRAREQAFDLHVQWLDLHSSNDDIPDYSEAVMAEPAAILERVLFDEQRPWREAFTMPETWVDPLLASTYDLDDVSEARWVDVRAGGRGGLLGTAAWLMRPVSIAETSPTLRGKAVRERMMCEPIDPPPAAVVSDAPPDVSLGACRLDRYEAHRDKPQCASCHDLMDPIGFGLERYDGDARFRTEEAAYVAQLGETGLSPCPIDGVGDLGGLGTFEGPHALGVRLADAGVLDRCFVQHLVGFHRGVRPLDQDPADTERLASAWEAAGGRYDQLLVALIEQEAFAHREVE